MKIEIELEDYIEYLNKIRNDREEKFPIPDEVWEYFIEGLRNGVTLSNYNPIYIIDNISVNGDYYTFDEYREWNPNQKGKSDEEIKEMLEDNVVGFTKHYIIVIL